MGYAGASDSQSNEDFDALLEDTLERAALWLQLRIPRAAGHVVDADDVLQEATLEALMSRDRFDASRPFGGWFFGILKHVYHQHLAKRRRRPADLLGDADGELLAHSTAISSRAARKDDVRSIREFMDSHDDYSKALLALFGLEGLKAPEVAKAMSLLVPRDDAQPHKPDTCSKHWRALRSEIVRAVPTSRILAFA